MIAHTFAQNLDSKTCTGTAMVFSECPGSANLNSLTDTNWQSICGDTGVCSCDEGTVRTVVSSYTGTYLGADFSPLGDYTFDQICSAESSKCEARVVLSF